MQKRIVVLGGSRGVGRVIVHSLNAEGAQVLAVARGKDALAALKNELSAIQTLALDVTADRAPEAVFERMRPDVLINCVGAKRTGSPFYELDWPEFPGRTTAI